MQHDARGIIPSHDGSPSDFTSRCEKRWWTGRALRAGRVGWVALATLTVALLAGCATDTATGSDRAASTARPAATATASTDTALLGSLARPDDLPPRLEAPLQRRREYLFVRTTINGQDAGLFLLDTGAAISAVDPGVAGRLELPASGGAEVIGIGGRQPFQYRLVDSVAIGRLGLDVDRLAGVNLLRISRNFGAPINGVIGYPQISPVPFTLDQRDNVLRWHRRDAFQPPSDADRSRLFRRYGLPVTVARVGDRREVWLILDTGADHDLTLHRDVLDKWPDIIAAPATGASGAAGVGGRVTTTESWLTEFELFGVTLRDVPVSFEDPPPHRRRDPLIAGRIGNRLLKHFRLTFDDENDWIWAEWLPGQ